ncbi:response regulator [Paenibacillus eucommiae]|uniref:Two-component system response regulator YesN n=1 Tax=Paenibacillus eucommiae TaxID=1355755 RepID=A0ABS4IX65_9BACL|nr:response regulator [Paenibacillus eucommiae]MBP1991675.1 two-component system response regulator YesN [Paenibacillus eucommiae]
MSYRMLIVDDEEDIREGLTDFVDWSSLGYTVVARLEDGQDAIAYIRSHPVDVILTDIKMTFVSGLELAKYVYDHQYDIKMILISGYKEFEFAQQAVNYQVAHYLLKPTRLEEINRVFRDVKVLLDKEKAEKERTNAIQSRNEEMMSVLQRQFFIDLTVGALQDREELERRLQLIGLPVEPESTPCCLYDLSFSQHESDFQENQDDQTHNANRLFRFIQHIYKNEIEGILYTPLCTSAASIQIAALDVSGGTQEKALIEKIILQFETAKSRIRATFGMDTTVENMQFYPHLMEIAARNPIQAAPSPAATSFLLAADAAGTGAGARAGTGAGHLADLPATAPADSLVIHKAKLYIQAMYDKEISLEDVAEHVYLSPVYFSRHFKKQTGRNFTDYLTEVRMIRAMEYLRLPQYKVYEIGAIIGYKSTKYFFKLFKQYAGCTPTEYRNNLQDGTRR